MEVKMFRVSQGSTINQCYLVYAGDIGVLIDPVWDYELINNYLENNRITVKGIFLTHSHNDHTNLAPRFAKEKNIPVYMSETEIDYYGFDCFNLNKVHHLQALFIGDLKITPILTPGHTKGSMCYLIGKHIFTGDTIFIEGVGICDTYGGDANQMYDSVQFLKSYLPENILFWPGHSFGEPAGKEFKFLLKYNIYFQFEQKKQFTNFRMREKQPDPFGFM